jgi:hypothetical protein
MPGGKNTRRVKTFTCPNCKALYQVLRVDEGPETKDREIACHSCRAPLLGREGQFVLKYYFLRNAERRPKTGTALRRATT